MSTQVHEQRLRDAILDLLAYFAFFGLPCNEQQIFQLLPVKTNPVAVHVHVQKLLKRGKIIALPKQTYGLKDITYINVLACQKDQALLLKRAKLVTALLRPLPFIKSVAIMSSIPYGYCRVARSDIDLVFVTSPNRVFISSYLVVRLINLLGINTLSKDMVLTKPGRIDQNAYITTNGAKFDKDLAKFDKHHQIWLALAQPLYGHDYWYQIVDKSPFVRQGLPNFQPPRYSHKIPRNGLSLLNRVDNYGYRRYLRHVANNPLMHTPDAFVRVRPDIIRARTVDNLWVREATRRIAEIRQAI